MQGPGPLALSRRAHAASAEGLKVLPRGRHPDARLHAFQVQSSLLQQTLDFVLRVLVGAVAGPHLPHHARPATAQTRRGTRRSSPIAHPERGALLASVGRAGPPYVRLVARTKPRYSAITFDRVRKSLSENSPAPAPRSMLWRQRRPRCSAAQGPLGHVRVRLAFVRRRRFFLLVRQRRPLRVARRRTEVRSHRRIMHAHSVPQHTDLQTWSLPVAGGLQWAPRGATPGGSPSLVPVLQARADILAPWRLVPWPSAGRESVHS